LKKSERGGVDGKCLKREKRFGKRFCPRRKTGGFPVQGLIKSPRGDEKTCGSSERSSWAVETHTRIDYGGRKRGM